MLVGTVLHRKADGERLRLVRPLLELRVGHDHSEPSAMGKVQSAKKSHGVGRRDLCGAKTLAVHETDSVHMCK